MAADVNRSRNYRSPLRAQQALATRERVVEAARRLFVERGYAATTISAVADAAEVSDMTVYTAFRDKHGLLQAVIGTAIGGPNYAPHSDEFALIPSLPTARQRLRAWIDHSCAILARTSPIHAVIRAAADKEPKAVELRATLLHARLASNQELVQAYLHDALRPGLTEHEAAQHYCALTSPELHHLLTVELGWTARQHNEWLADTLDRELLGPS